MKTFLLCYDEKCQSGFRGFQILQESTLSRSEMINVLITAWCVLNLEFSFWALHWHSNNSKPWKLNPWSKSQFCSTEATGSGEDFKADFPLNATDDRGQFLSACAWAAKSDLIEECIVCDWDRSTKETPRQDGLLNEEQIPSWSRETLCGHRVWCRLCMCRVNTHGSLLCSSNQGKLHWMCFYL